MVLGDPLDKHSEVDLDTCQKLCNQKIGCTHFNFYYRQEPNFIRFRVIFHDPFSVKFPLTLGQDVFLCLPMTKMNPN